MMDVVRVYNIQQAQGIGQMSFRSTLRSHASAIAVDSSDHRRDIRLFGAAVRLNARPLGKSI